MNSSDITPGTLYAYRRSAASREPFQRIEAVERVTAARGKWKVRFLDEPYPGLEEYVRSACIIAPWSEAKRIVRYERKLARLRDVSDCEWPGDQHPLAEAVNVVLDATGEDIYLDGHGLFRGPADAVRRVASRAGQEPDGLGVAFEHEGEFLSPFHTGMEIAQAFAAAEPGTVHQHLDLQQRRWEAEMNEPGHAHLASLVNRWRAGWALARQWAGQVAALQAKDEEIRHLREVISRHVWDLRFAYPDDAELQRKTARLERAVRGQ